MELLWLAAAILRLRCAAAGFRDCDARPEPPFSSSFCAQIVDVISSPVEHCL